MSEHSLPELREIGARINSQEFDHVFVLHADGTVTDGPSNVYAPDVYHDDDSDIRISGEPGWRAMTGLTGQDSYSGAVMHPSEFIGAGVASTMLEMTGDAPMTFAIVAVYDMGEAEDDDMDIVGWAIVYHEGGDES